MPDLDQVTAIEQRNYEFPWTRDIFHDCMKVGYECFGLQVERQLAGYAIHSCGAGECHLLNLCIDQPWRRRGFAGILLENVVNRAGQTGCWALLLEVRPSNPAAVALYRRRGFRKIGRRPGYYRARDGREDAIVMQLDL